MIGIVSFAHRRGFAVELGGLLSGFGSHLAAVSKLLKYSSSAYWSIGLIGCPWWQLPPHQAQC